MPTANQRDNRHAHPQGFTARGGAIIGKGIQDNIDFIIEIKMSGRIRNEGLYFDAPPGNTMLLECGEDMFPRRSNTALFRLKHQSGVWQLLQNGTPYAHHIRRQFCQIVK